MPSSVTNPVSKVSLSLIICPVIDPQRHPRRSHDHLVGEPAPDGQRHGGQVVGERIGLRAVSTLHALVVRPLDFQRESVAGERGSRPRIYPIGDVYFIYTSSHLEPPYHQQSESYCCHSRTSFQHPRVCRWRKFQGIDHISHISAQLFQESE